MNGHQPCWYVLKSGIPAESPLLGRIVQHFQDPGAQYTPEDPSTTVTFPKIEETLKTGFRVDLRTAKDNALRSRLRGLLSFADAVAGEQEYHLEAAAIRERRLTKYGDVFKLLVSVQEVREKLTEMMPEFGSKTFLIVGTLSISGGSSIKNAGKRSTEKKAHGILPVGSAAMAAASGVGGLPRARQAVGDVELEAERKTSSDWSMEGVTVDEEIFAIDCRVISRSWAGCGREVKYRDTMPRFPGGLTMGRETTREDNDEESDDENTQWDISEEGLLLDDLGSLGGHLLGVSE
ncbi:MAG: hypothetical protein M1840_002532 [Geoglossum simile]|nr:MAG: hypothetical protein M1840_002532 [Geoglossum simile]